MIATLVALITVADARVAYSARYYSPATSKVKSSYQVYVCDLDGQRRRQISVGAKDCGGVRWTGQHSLAWIVQGASPELWTITDIDSGKPKLLKRAKSIYAEQFFSTGSAVYNIDGKRMALTDGVLSPAKPASDPPKEQSFAKPGAGKVTIRLGQGVWDWSMVVQPSQGVPITTRHSDDNLTFIQAQQLKPSDDLIVVTFAGNSTTRGSFSVGRLDWTTGNLDALAWGSDVDFRPNRALWAGVSPRDLAPLGKGEVWVSEATVADWRTGRIYWKGKGMVDFTSISLR